MEWYIFRHGQTVDNKAGRWTSQLPGELSDLGREQARNLGGLLKIIQPDLIIASDLKRAFDTAEIAARIAGYERNIVKDPRLREIYFGDFQGKTIEEMREICGLPEFDGSDIRYMNRESRERLFGGLKFEPLEDIMGRRDSFLAYMTEMAKGKEVKKIATVSHSAFIGYLIEGILYRTCGENVESSFYPQKNDEVSIMRYDDNGDLRGIEINRHVDSIRDGQ